MKAADSVQITTLVDNYVNGLLSSSEGVMRPRLGAVLGDTPAEPCISEFGWSALIKINSSGRDYTILFDTGLGKQALLHNARALKIDLSQVGALVVSHGHPDHTASTPEVISAIGRDDVPIILHPNALRKTVIMLPNGERFDAGYFLDEVDLHERGGKIEKTKTPTLLASETAHVTGEIPRQTDFEKGMPPNMHFRVIDGNLVHDQIIPDDQGLVINVKGKGLVVVSGCAHAGIINTVKYASEISDGERVHAVIGGFHLSGDYFSPIVDETIREMKNIAPKVILPSHCTGIRALIKIANALPDSFIENSVGTTFQF